MRMDLAAAPVLVFRNRSHGELNIVYRRIDELKPDPANPRRHSKQQIRKIADSIQAFGFNVPVLIDREKNVVAGHGRLLACDELGWTEVATVIVDIAGIIAGAYSAEQLRGERRVTAGAADVMAFPFLKYAVLGLPANDDDLFHRILVEHQPLAADSPVRAWVQRVDARPRS